MAKATRVGDKRAGGELHAVSECLMRICEQQALTERAAVDVDDERVECLHLRVRARELLPFFEGGQRTYRLGHDHDWARL